MRYLVCTLFLTLASVSSFAATEHFIKIGDKSPEILWLKSKNIKTRNVHIIGIQTAKGNQIERVIPKSEYSKILSEYTRWQKQLSKTQLFTTQAACLETITFNNSTLSSKVCLDRMQSVDKSQFFLWYRKQKDLAAGSY